MSYRDLPAYIYVLRSSTCRHPEGTIPVKIGLTNRPKARFKELGLGWRYTAVLHLEQLPTYADAQARERQLHQRFRHCEIASEEFALLPEELEALCEGIALPYRQYR